MSKIVNLLELPKIGNFFSIRSLKKITANVRGFVAVGEIEFVQPVQMPIKDTEFKLEQNVD